MKNRDKRLALLTVGLILLAGVLSWLMRSPQIASAPSVPVAAAPKPQPIVAVPLPPAPLPPAAPKKPKAPPAPKAPAIQPQKNAGVPVAPVVELHKELIPKNIEIVRCYYSQGIAQPGTTLGFDINGSGFTAEFEKMIKVEVENDDIRVKDLSLVTANQIHGSLEIGKASKTAFVYPRVLIKGLPVFSAQEPFGVVRKGEVLTVFFYRMDEKTRGGQFRVITNLDDELYKQLAIEMDNPGLEISGVEPHLPYGVDGTLKILSGVPTGAYGVTVRVGSRQAYRRSNIISIVKPIAGISGYVERIVSPIPFYRPGDEIQLFVVGNGFSPQDASALNFRVDEFAMGKGTFSYVSSLQMRLNFASPSAAPLGSYGITVLAPNGDTLLHKDKAFTIVGVNWIGGLQEAAALKVGKKGTLNVLGRDLSPDFVKSLRIDADEPGISVGALRQVSASVVAADISVGPKVAPGDYWLHLSSKGKKIDPPFGSIIKIE